ncbi:hypothetical protein NE237_021217 [Protea cynaroides]|uniref:BAG domain-containing protein n=1 Tax=Protea cynaroides TaxID=273540 RepID=A0A9Q0K3B7_9MAGN|nr:hypothetical protein NE237_021217 [Protea cynaroides]
MDSLYWSSPRSYHPSYARGIPVQHRQTKSPKIISIPVHFVGAEKSRSEAVLKIQKVFRGFLVRKNLRKIAAIRKEVDEIDRRISLGQTAQLIRRDPKERLKVNEMLMALLLRLDSVPGIDSGVRICRKAMIKRAILLQERLDAIVGDGSTVDTRDGGEMQCQTLDVGDSADSQSFMCQTVAEELDRTLDTKESADSLGNWEGIVNGTLGTKDLPESLDETATLGYAADEALDMQSHAACSVNSSDGEPFLAAAACQNVDESRDDRDAPVEALNKADTEVDASEKSETVTGKDIGAEDMLESSECSHQSMVEEGEEETLKGLEDVKETNSQPDITGIRNLDGITNGEDREKGRDDIDNIDNNNNHKEKELIERVIHDNERMMGLMTELLERNELQTRLISSLSQRVEQMERAFKCERLKRKKKRQAAAVTAERQDTTLDPRKCVKKSS